MKESGIYTMTRQNMASVLLMIAAVVWIMNMPGDAECYQKNTTCYGVHAASFRTLSGAYALIESLKKEGCQPFYVNVDIPGKGTWYRVFACFCESRDDAVTRAVRMEKQGILEDYKVLEIERAIIPENNGGITKRDGTGSQVIHEETHENKRSDLSVSHAPTVMPSVSLQHDRPDSKEKKESNSPVKDEAAQEYESGQYEAALNQYRVILQRKDLSSDLKETAVIRMADCYFQIGIKGNKQALFQAIEHYRSLINTYSGNKDAVAVARLRLARCYEHVTMYYEAIRELLNLREKHPDSSCNREATHLLGTIYYKQKKYREAAKEFEGYVKIYQNATDIKTIYFTIGECYSRINEYQKADKWYREALRRWPDVENLSQNDLMRLGSHYFRSGQYDPAIRILFVYINLYPDQDKSGEAMVMIAKSYIGKGDIPLGLRLLSLVMERFPETEEAEESVVTMANLGVDHPGIQLPRYILTGIDCYDNPIETYSRAVATSSNSADKEEIMLKRGRALATSKRYEEAFDDFCDLLERFKPGRKTKESRKNLVGTGEILVDRWFEQKDYAAIADLYFRARRNGLFEYGDFKMLFKIGKSLGETGLLSDARMVFNEMKGMKTSEHERGQIVLALARVYFDMGQYDEAVKGAQMIMNNPELSDRSRLQQAREIMGDICYRKEMYKKAARYYSAIIGSGDSGDNMSRVYKKYADTLKNEGFFPSALVNYERALNNSNNSTGDDRNLRVGSYGGLGDCYFHEGHYEKSIDMYKKSLAQASDKDSNLWSLYWMGLGCVNLDNKAEADHIFTSLKEKGQDEFWTALVDYSIDDKFWSDLYHRYANN